MDDIYYLASLKLSGWLTKTGQYSSDIKSAQEYTREAALATASRHRSNHHILVPVRKRDMEEIV